MTDQAEVIDGALIQRVEYAEIATGPRTHRRVIVDHELERLYQENGGLTPEMIVSSAQSKESPLHTSFEWDDAEGGKRWRLAQATQMLLASRVMATLIEQRKNEQPRIIAAQPIRHWVNSHREGMFLDRPKALSNDDLRAEQVKRKLAILRSWCKGVVDLPELEPIRQAIVGLLSKT